MKKTLINWLAKILGAGFVAGFAITSIAQVAPGPHEMLPFQDAFIIEAFKDLQIGVGIADWTGYSGTTWVSPNAYNDHMGTDSSVQTATPLYATAAGVVVETVNIFPRDDHSTAFGNFVRIAVDGAAPNGEALDVIYMHMLEVAVTVGQRLSVGDYVGLSDNTGNSTSEHVHFQSQFQTNGLEACPFYWGHFKYPIVFNPTGTFQVGRVIKINAISTPIRTNRFDTSLQISTAYKDQLYFASFAKRGYYQVFIPNNTSWRSGWVRATHVEELFVGTVIQSLPDNVAFSQLGQLSGKYAIRSAPDDVASSLGQIVFGGGRFVADQITNGYYRIPLPGASARWGWVKPNNRMIVYPQLTNPNLDLSTLPKNDFPIVERFPTNGVTKFGRPKFNHAVVTNSAPSSPGGDGKAVFITDQTNHGDGTTDSLLVGKPGQTNYFVQSDMYFNYQPSYLTGAMYERAGVFLRDDGFAGLDTTFEGAGNCYALVWDDDDGRLRAGKIVDGVVTDFLSPVKTVTGSGWHTMRIEARGNQITYFLDGQLLVQVNDSTFASGQCGIGYSFHPNGYPAARGVYFDNFVADTLDPVPLHFSNVSLQPDGKLHLFLNSDVGSTNTVERSSTLTNWNFFTNIVNSNSVVEFSVGVTNTNQFYRAKRLP